MEGQSALPVRVSIVFPDKAGKHIAHNIAPSLPDAYSQAINGLAIGPASGSCGTALFRGEAVYVTEIATDPLWAAYRDLALPHGLHACWSMPIHSARGELLGAFACYYLEPKSPTSRDVEAMTLATQTVALVIERHRSDQALRAAEARHRQIFNSATDFAIIGTDLRGTITSWNEGAHRILGWGEAEMLGNSVHRFFTPEDVAQGLPEMEMACALRQGYSPDERWHQRKNGERFWAAGQMTPLKSDDGRVIGFVKILRDHTEYKQAATQLQQLALTLEEQVADRTRERDRIWRNSLDLLLVIGSDGILRAVNPAWTSSLGYEPSELVAQHFTPFVHPEDVTRTRNAIVHAYENRVEQLEIRLRHKDGSYRWFAWRAALEDGIVYANGRDITLEKRQADQLLLASETRLQLALAAGEMGAWEWNLHSNDVIWLQGAALVHGVAPAAGPVVFPLDDYLRHVHPDDRNTLTEVLARAMVEGSNHRAEYRVVWPDGSVHWVEARGDMFFDDNGKPQHMVGVTVNITRRKRTEQDLAFLARASAELAGLIDEQSTLARLAYLAVPSFADWCAVDLLNDDGSLQRVAVAHVEPEKVQWAHELHRRFPPDPRSPTGIWHVVRTGQAELAREITDEMLEQTITDPEHLSAIKALGIKSFIAVPLSVHGKTLGVVTFIAAESGRLYEAEDLALAEDLAQRTAVAMENAILYRALREADRAKDVFLATLAHELRSPLAAITGGLEMMALAGDDKKRVEKYTKLMQRQAAHLVRLVDDLMDISRISRGKIELKKERSSLAGILSSAVDTSRPHIEAANHTLRVTLPGTATDIIADPVRLA